MTHQRPRLLIVDDHPMVRYSLVTVLSDFEEIIVVGEADDGQKALTFCQQFEPDIVLMDISMPVMDGITATWHIHQEFPDIRVIMLTSTVDPDEIDVALNAGAWAFLTKNIDIAELEHTLQSAIKDQRLAAVTNVLSSLPEPILGYANYDALLIQRAGCFEQRRRLYQEINRLQQEEKDFFRYVQTAYTSLEGQIQSHVDVKAIIEAYRQEHRKLIRQLREVRAEVEGICVQTQFITSNENGRRPFAAPA